jgi:hypothetical protein
MKIFKSLIAIGALILGIGMSGAASADTFTLANDNGGDGFVTSILGGFDLFGSDNSSGANYTTYLATAAVNESLTFNWTYTTNDCCGSYWDPAGYVINGSYTQLSTDTPAGDASGTYVGLYDTSGVVTLNVLAGQSYGFYVFTQDGVAGRGDIAVTANSATPLPAALPLFATGLGALGLAGWRRKKKAAPLAA